MKSDDIDEFIKRCLGDPRPSVGMSGRKQYVPSEHMQRLIRMPKQRLKSPMSIEEKRQRQRDVRQAAMESQANAEASIIDDYCYDESLADPVVFIESMAPGGRKERGANTCRDCTRTIDHARSKINCTVCLDKCLARKKSTSAATRARLIANVEKEMRKGTG